MKILPYRNELEAYLPATDIIDYDNPSIMKLADTIEKDSKDTLDYIKNAYEYVRDRIGHSADINNDKLTCKASEVLKEGHGICFAKSHLLAALLRCKSIPAGMCYQNLILDDETAPFLVFHGLNGVYIESQKRWVRLDPRGNKPGVNAQFSTEDEMLAFPVRSEKGEEDIRIVYHEPDKKVLERLQKYDTRTELWDDLPKELAYDYDVDLKMLFEEP